MGLFFLRKIKQSLLTLFFVAILIFFLMRFSPGSPFVDDHFFNQATLEAFKKHHGLDLPIYIQFLKFIKGIITFDLGPSLSYENVYVSEIIKQTFPISLVLGLISLFFSILFGTVLALARVFILKKNIRRSLFFISLSALAMPTFLSSSIFQYLFAIKLKIFPLTGSFDFASLILPAFSLAMIPSGKICNLLKTKLEDVIKQPFYYSAEAKGIGFYRILFVHLLPASVLPVLSYLGPLAATLITGSFACEKIFAIPGLGSWFVSSLGSRDYPLIAGLTLFYTFIILAFSFAVDFIYTLLDPKLKKELYRA